MRIVKYFFVGAIAAAVDIGLFSLFAGYLGLPWVPISIATFILATLVNYLLSIKMVFESGLRHSKKIEVVGVFMISGSALLLNQLVLYFCIELLFLNLVASKIIATSTVFFWNYFGRSKFVF